MSSATELTNMAYDILKVLGKDAAFYMIQSKLIFRMLRKPINQSWFKYGKQSKMIGKDICICLKKH